MKSRVINKIFKRISELNPENYIFIATFCMFVILWFGNFSNKVIAASIFGLIFVLYYKIKNIQISTLVAYLASSVIFTGKTYPHQIVPIGVLPIEIYPLGFFTNITLTPQLILSCFMFFLILRDIANKKIYKFKVLLIDILLVLFFTWPIFSDLVASRDPEFSLLLSFMGLDLLVFYFFIKLYAIKVRTILAYFISVMSSLIVFESLISFQQFLIKSPVFKNLEYMVNIEYFGNAADEIQFAFRPLGTFPHANSFGVWLASLTIPILLILLIKPTKKFFLIFTVGFTALIMTLSRSSWLGFFAGTVICLAVIEKIKKLKFSKLTFRYLGFFWLAAPVLAVLFVLPRLEKSTNTLSNGGGYFRQVQLERAAATISTNPLFGVGTGRSVQEGLDSLNSGDENVSIVQNVHNWYVLTTVEHGLPFIILFVLIVGVYIKNYIKKLSIMTIPIKNFNGIIQMGLFGSVIANLIIGIFQPFINLQIVIFTIAIFYLSENKSWNV